MQQFVDICPYDDSQIADAMARIVADPLFENIRQYLFADYSADDFAALFLSVDTVDKFQMEIMHQAIERILDVSHSSFTINGLDNIEKDKAYVFVSNHRDIMLDSAILQVGLVDNGFRTTEITFGANLMRPQITVDIGKSNKMFKVVRASNTREFLTESKILSQYIRHSIVEKGESIWIAQRNGRTKDGNDRTEQGLIKMFAFGGGRTSLAERIAELNIVPIVVSYQWEPCDALKTRELYLSRRAKYEKSSGEDFNSIMKGITQDKGAIVINVLTPLNTLWNGGDALSDKDAIGQITEIIDCQIHCAYHLFDTNYLAWDLLHHCHQYLDVKYTNDLRVRFCQRMHDLLSAVEGDRDELEDIFLGIYAQPVDNRLKNCK